MTNKQQTIQEWIAKNVEIKGDDDCWIANGIACNKKGWHISFKSYRKKWLAHRAAWVVANGEIPDGLCVCHKCDNPKCCNPRHLFLGTRSDNAKDMWQKNRGSVGCQKLKGIKRGQSQHRSLDKTDVVKVFELYKNGLSQKDIAIQFSISDVSVSNILIGRTSEEFESERNQIRHLLGRGVKKKLLTRSKHG